MDVLLVVSRHRWGVVVPSRANPYCCHSPQLNKNNAKKDQLIADVEKTMYDLVEKHAASLEILETEHINADEDLHHEVEVLQAEVNHLKWQVDNQEEMERQNIAMKEERDMLMSELSRSENKMYDETTLIKKEILKQEEKLEKQFKKVRGEL